MRYRHYILLAVTALPCAAYSALDSNSIAACAAISGDLERLECFDSLTAKNIPQGTQAERPETSGEGKWKSSRNVNPIDDSTTLTISLVADSGRSKFGNPVEFVARCQSGNPETFIKWGDYIGTKAMVVHRVGDEPAATSEWALSTDKQATFYPRSVRLLRAMLDADRLIAQVTPYNENPMTAIFDTSGMDKVIQPLRDACNW